MDTKTKEEILTGKIIIPDYLKDISGIYFLISDGVIVYVGQTKNLTQRLMTHVKDVKKEFDSYSFIPIEGKQELDVYEAYYIQTLNCKYNKQVPSSSARGELLKRLLIDKSGSLTGELDKKEPTIKQKAHYKRLKDERETYWKEVSDVINKDDELRNIKKYTLLKNGDLLVGNEK